MSAQANFAGARARRGRAAISAANPNRDGTGTLALLFTPGDAGSRIDSIIVKATGTTTAGMIRLFCYEGANYTLTLEIPVHAVTPSASVQTFEARLNSAQEPDVLPIILPAGHSLYVSTHNAEGFHVSVEGGDF